MFPIGEHSIFKAPATTCSMLKAALLVCMFAFAQAQVDYCSEELCDEAAIHTACIHQLYSWSEACQEPNIEASLVFLQDIPTILDYHNALRRKVAKGEETEGAEGPQPGASNMRKLEWNVEIAAIAQTLAQQCVFEHDRCRNIAGIYVGQNLAIIGSSGNATIDWKYAIDMWYNEVKDMVETDVKEFGTGDWGTVGHYTQVVWAETYQIGCGVSMFKEDDWSKVLYVCNYGPGGNVGGSPMYKIGEAASECPEGTTPDDGLCA